MGTQPPPHPVMHFGPFEVDLASAELRRAGMRVRIQKQPLQLLTILLENPGQLVTRQQLQKRLWQGDTFVDFEDGLNTAIKKLRETLGDERDHPQFIETVPRRGYRFIADIETVELHAPSDGPNGARASTGPATDAGARENEIRKRGEARKTWVIASLTTAVAAVAAFAIWWYTPLPPPAALRIFPATTSGRLDFIAKPATDGTRIFYLERQGDHWDLMQTSVNGGAAQRIPTPFRNARILDVSPDHTQFLLGSFDQRGADMQIWAMPAQGGPPARIGDIVAAEALWTPDGKGIVYASGPNILEADTNGGNKKVLANVPKANFWFSWSPDGKKLRFTRVEVDRPASSIWEMDRDGMNLHRVALRQDQQVAVCCGSWVLGGRYFVFSSSKDGLSGLWAYREESNAWRRSPRGPFQLTEGPLPFHGAVAGGDAARVYSYGYHGQGEAEVLDPKSGAFAPYLPGFHAMHVAFSQDGEQIAYVDDRDRTLWKSRPDGSGRVQLTLPPLSVTFPTWSPDGQSISFTGMDTLGSVMVYRVGSDGGTPEAVDLGKTDVRDPSWSPDGKEIAVAHASVASNPSAPHYAIFVVNWSEKQERLVPESDDMTAPRWSPDGRFLVGVTEDQRELRLYDMTSHRWHTIARGTAFGIPAWSRNGLYIYFQDLLGSGEAIQRFRVSDSSVEHVIEFSSYLNSGITRCAFLGLNASDAPMVSFDRSYSDLYGLELSLP
jgi:Tol biopolymer transport system component/DNA-binding winged helix-turn-helix (wHTH) protein